MNEFLSTDELAALVGCRTNQRMMMIRWLDKNHWIYVLDRNSAPRVLREYRNQKMGIANGSRSTKTSLSQSPNVNAFR